MYFYERLRWCKYSQPVGSELTDNSVRGSGLQRIPLTQHDIDQRSYKSMKGNSAKRFNMRRLSNVPRVEAFWIANEGVKEASVCHSVLQYCLRCKSSINCRWPKLEMFAILAESTSGFRECSASTEWSESNDDSDAVRSSRGKGEYGGVLSGLFVSQLSTVLPGGRP